MQQTKLDPNHDSLVSSSNMAASSDAGHFFQTSDSVALSERRAVKAKNKRGNPIALPSKILALIRDIDEPENVLVAEAAGDVKRVRLEVCTSIKNAAASLPSLTPTSDEQCAENLHTG